MYLLSIIISVVVAVAIVFWPFPHKSRLIGFVRFITAVFLVWFALGSWESQARWQRMHDRKIAGDTHAFDYDTGGGAAMMLIGWIPASVAVGGLWCVRLLVIHFRRHEKSSA